MKAVVLLNKPTAHLASPWPLSLLKLPDTDVCTLHGHVFRVVIKSRGPGIFPGYYESGPRLLLLENRRKIEPKEIPSRLIPRLLVLFTRQLEILVTTLCLTLR